VASNLEEEYLVAQIFYDQNHAAITRGDEPLDSLTSAVEDSVTTIRCRLVRADDQWPTSGKPWLSYIESRLVEIEGLSTWDDGATKALAAARQFVQSFLWPIDPPAPSVVAIDDEETIEFSWQKNGMHLIAAFSEEGTEVAWMSKAATGSAPWHSREAFEGFLSGLTRVSSDVVGASLASQ